MFKKDVKLDSYMVFGAMQGRFAQMCIHLDMNTKEAFARDEWLKKQSRQYIHQVEMAVKKLEVDAIKNSLK